jgi:predicted DNA-binding transcriptional regulator AlpA
MAESAALAGEESLMAHLQTSANSPPRLAGKFARRKTAELAAAKLAQGDNYADVELFTEVHLAQLLQTSKSALQHWRFKGIGPRFLKLGSRWIRYSRKDVGEWIAGLAASQASKREDGCR